MAEYSNSLDKVAFNAVSHEALKAIRKHQNRTHYKILSLPLKRAEKLTTIYGRLLKPVIVLHLISLHCDARLVVGLVEMEEKAQFITENLANVFQPNDVAVM